MIKSTFKPLIIFCFSLFLNLVFQNMQAQPSRFERKVFTGKNEDTLLYRLLYPDYNPGRKYPLIIFLHGSGERGNDNEAQLKWGVANFATDEMMMKYPAIVIAPQCPNNQEWSKYSGKLKLENNPSKPMQLVHDLISQLKKEMPVDTNRIYITGLSMGGFGTFDAMARYPDLFAAAVPVCGGGDTSTAAIISKIPCWIFHGAEDVSVSPLFSLNMLKAMLNAGAHPGFTMYPEVGHFSWLAAYSDPLMIAWLFRQHK